MTHATDVPATALLPRLATELKTRQSVTPPPWATFVKTGVHKQLARIQPDWWTFAVPRFFASSISSDPRASSVSPRSTGGKRDRGSAPYHARTGSRAILREIVHQLEGSGLVQGQKNRGRKLSPEGQRLLDQLSKEVLTKLTEKRPELGKYL